MIRLSNELLSRWSTLTSKLEQLNVTTEIVDMHTVPGSFKFMDKTTKQSLSPEFGCNPSDYENAIIWGNNYLKK